MGFIANDREPVLTSIQALFKTNFNFQFHLLMTVRTGNASNALKSSCHKWNLIHWEAARRTGCFLGSTAQHKIQKDNSLDQVIGELAGWAIQILPNKHYRVFCFPPFKTHQGVLFSAPADAQTDGAKVLSRTAS